MKLSKLMPAQILVELDRSAEKTESGILIADVWEGGRAIKTSAARGDVMMVGEGTISWKDPVTDRMERGNANDISVGDKIQWKANHESMYWEEDGEEWMIVHRKNVLMKL